MMGELVRRGLVIALMLAGMPAKADTGSSAVALPEIRASRDAFRQLLDKTDPEHDLPEASDPAVAAILAAIWNPDLLQVPNPIKAEDLQNLDGICLNGMIAWKLYLFDRLDGLDNLEAKVLKRMVRYQAEFGSGVAFSIRCAAAFINAYETASPEATVDQRGAYEVWVDREKGWIVSSFAIVCAGNLAADNSRHLSNALHAVFPELLAAGRRTLDRPAFLTSVQDAMAEAAVVAGTRDLNDCSDLKALLATGANSDAH